MWRATKLERRGSKDKENTIDFEEMKPSLQSSKVGVLVSCCHMCDNAHALSIVLIIVQLLSFLWCALYVHKENESVEPNLLAGYTSMLKYSSMTKIETIVKPAIFCLCILLSASSVRHNKVMCVIMHRLAPQHL